MDLEAEGTGCNGSAAGLAKQSPTPGSAHLLSNVLALSTPVQSEGFSPASGPSCYLTAGNTCEYVSSLGNRCFSP